MAVIRKQVPLLRLAAAWAVLAAAPAALAQDDHGILEEVTVTATRLPSLASSLPVAVGIVGRDDIQLGRQQLGLDESLSRVPGLFFQNRYNFAQDLRIAIRGFGARADFGIRGIRLYVDDIPLTLPDGQSSVDALDLSTIRRIEVIRGPYSSVYGASAGGVIRMVSDEGPDRPMATARLNIGSYDYRQWQARLAGRSGGVNYLVNYSSTRLDGYRVHSATENDLLTARLHVDFDEDTSLTLLATAVDSPLADDPGGLNAGEVASDRRQAAPRNLAFDAGESLDQQTAGLSFRHTLADGHDIMLRGYALQRDFANRLPFDINSNGQGGSVDLGRKAYGAGAQYTFRPTDGGLLSTLTAGLDRDALRDHRRRFANDLGVRGELTTDQDEDVTSTGVYLQAVLAPSDSIDITIGGRFDRVRYRIDNRLEQNTGSGQRTFEEFSPLVGVNWRVKTGLNVYANLSRSFDPPGTTELANPDGPTGFNEALDSQTATNYEVGLKGLDTGRIRYDLALFHIDVADALVPFELSGSGQTFYQNAGRSTHRGVEATLSLQMAESLLATVSYTWSDFTFDRFSGSDGASFDGNRIPGIPEHLLFAELNWSIESGWYAVADVLYAGALYADNANQTRADSSIVANLRLGWRGEWDNWSVSPFVGINNLFDEKYFSNVRLNAAFGRYWEPAPERNLYGGIQIDWRF